MQQVQAEKGFSNAGEFGQWILEGELGWKENKHVPSFVCETVEGTNMGL